MDDAQRQLIREVVREAAQEIHTYPREHNDWVELAMQREARREKLYNSVIEKSFAAIVWAALAGLASGLYYYVRDHWR